MIKTNIDFMGMRKYVFVLSGTLILFFLLSIFVFIGFNQGIDFSGGLTANLTINFKESDIGMLRDLFGNVRLERRFGAQAQVPEAETPDAQEEAAADGPNVFYENLGTSISGFETRDTKSYPSATYVIRIKNMEGVDKDQIEGALTSILAANFPPKTRISFSVFSRDSADTGAGLDAMLQAYQMEGSAQSSVIELRDGEQVTTRKLFVVSKDFETLPMSEMEYRNGITRLLLANPNYDLEEAVEFTSSIDWGSFNSVSSTIGAELESSAVWLSIVCVLIMLFYIAIRFDFRFGIGAVAGLVHTMLIVLGFISVTGREMNVTVVAAVLTIFGYAINDTIVVFDRIRENLQFSRKEDLLMVINRSVNETISRTIITSGTTLFAAFSIYIFAGEVLRDFAFALIIGVIFGTYTSTFIAAPVYYFMEKYTNKKLHAHTGHAQKA
ncbi:MAG: protein translocase subunit SecF [Spirochaetota bacterium]|jgi:preprotein translocase SecF subunit|nr:protein translocase subunit SecF [Spirochaetota bacterium]